MPVPVTVVVLCHNKWEWTRQCLAALRQNTPPDAFELIVGDNGSTDGTPEHLAETLAGWPGAKTVRFEENLGFVEGNNRASQSARGEILFLLNNDAEVQPGWIDPVLRTMERDRTVGALGCRLTYPDGRIQEAGGIVFRDGSGWNYGRGCHAGRPEFNFVRDVDYCSGAALAVRMSLWKKLGGFDRRYAPAYYEDTDLAFGIRQLGYRVIYHPHSRVIHHEGKTAGVDLNSGVKRFQEINRGKFAEKWARVLERHFPNSPRFVEKAALRHSASRILVADPFLPFFNRASGSLRLFHVLKLLKGMGFHVTFLARNGEREAEYRPVLEDLGIEVICWDTEAMKATGIDLRSPVPSVPAGFWTGRRFDWALLDFWELAGHYLPILRTVSPDTGVIVDSVDVHFVREFREAELAHDAGKAERAARRKTAELDVYGNADWVWVVTDQDRAVLGREIPQKPIAVVPNVHDIPEAGPRWEERSDLLFVGNFLHPPNEDAVLHFCRDIMPLIRPHLPGVTLRIVGQKPPESVTALAGPDIVIEGFVENLAGLLDRARVSVNPLRYGSGMKGKIGEAMAHGLPVVTTLVGAEGMDLEDGREAFVADSPEQFAEGVVRLYNDPDLWSVFSRNGREKVRSLWSPERTAVRLKAFFGEQAMDHVPDLVSIVVAVRDRLEYTRICLESILKNTRRPFELIVVDNGSVDGTSGYLEEMARTLDGTEGPSAAASGRDQGRSRFCRGMHVITHAVNRGFPAANNDGLRRARGEMVVLLNNDTAVTPGWLDRMVDVARRHPEVGIVGPMSNGVSGPQRVTDVSYDVLTLRGLDGFARKFSRTRAGRAEKFWRIVGFCMLVTRPLIRAIGGLDERFGFGHFEDDDYCLRAALAGFDPWIAGDAYVHHFGGRTFSGLNMDIDESIAARWKVFKEKWSIPEDLPYGRPYRVQDTFDLLRHHVPLKTRPVPKPPLAGVTFDKTVADLVARLEKSRLPETARALSGILRRIDALQPLAFDDRFRAARACLSCRAWDHAAEWLEALLKEDPKNVQCLADLSACRAELGKAGAALPDFQEALKTPGHHPCVPKRASLTAGNPDAPGIEDQAAARPRREEIHV